MGKLLITRYKIRAILAILFPKLVGTPRKKFFERLAGTWKIPKGSPAPRKVNHKNRSTVRELQKLSKPKTIVRRTAPKIVLPKYSVLEKIIGYIKRSEVLEQDKLIVREQIKSRTLYSKKYPEIYPSPSSPLVVAPGNENKVVTRAVKKLKKK